MIDRMAERWMDGLADRQTEKSCQEVTTWAGRAAWEVMDGPQRGLRGGGHMVEGRRWTDDREGDR